jgi:PKD repeat protein
MRKLLLPLPLLAGLALGCDSQPVAGPGIVTITETTTSTTTTTVPLPTVAAFVFSPITPQAFQDVFFNGSGSTPGSGRSIVSYNWDFGDGTMKTGPNTSHDFTPSGIYLVTLTVIDNFGDKASNAQPITVRP